MIVLNDISHYRYLPMCNYGIELSASMSVVMEMRDVSSKKVFLLETKIGGARTDENLVEWSPNGTIWCSSAVYSFGNGSEFEVIVHDFASIESYEYYREERGERVISRFYLKLEYSDSEWKTNIVPNADKSLAIEPIGEHYTVYNDEGGFIVPE